MLHPRIILQGDQAAASAFVGIAKKFARQTYEAGIRNKTYDLGLAKIRVEHYGSVLCKVWIETEGGQPFTSLAWLPEGLIVTPRTASAPYGYGFPKRHKTTGELINPPFGTALIKANEALNQVIINRYPNNKYLDKKDHIIGLPENHPFPKNNQRLRFSLDTPVSPDDERKYPFHQYDSIIYEPTGGNDEGKAFWSVNKNRVMWCDFPGVNYWDYRMRLFRSVGSPKLEPDGTFVFKYRQFDSDLQPLIYEEESDEWHCHWAEELLYDNVAFETIFQMTNTYREEVGRKPLVREIRGLANPAQLICAEIQRSHKQFHNNEDDYRPNYGTANQRAYNSFSFEFGGENLASGIKGGLLEEAGIHAATAWRNSPSHYSLMINATFDNHATTHTIFGGALTAIEESGSPPQTYDPRVTGYSYAQLFMMRKYWIYTGIADGCFNYWDTGSPIGPARSWLRSTLARFPFYYRGHGVYVQPFWDAGQAANQFVVSIGAAEFIRDGKRWFRFLCAEVSYDSTTQNHSTYKFISYICPINYFGRWKQENTLTVTHVQMVITQAFFHPDGNSAVFSISQFDFDNIGNFYLPVSNSHPLLFTFKRSFVRFESGGFSLSSFEPLKVNYIVETKEGDGTTVYVSRYRQFCSGDAVNHQYYNENGELLQLISRLDLDVDQTTDYAASPVYTAKFYCHEELVFPSGKAHVVVHQELLEGNPVGDCYFNMVLYLNPRDEDIFYLRMDLIKVNTAEDGRFAKGKLSLYHNDRLLNEWGEHEITTPIFNQSHHGFYDDNQLHMDCSWSSLSGAGVSTVAYNVYDINVSRDDIDTDRYPISAVSNTHFTNGTPVATIKWGTVAKRDGGKILIGEFPVSFNYRLGKTGASYELYRNGKYYYAAGYVMGPHHISPFGEFGDTNPDFPSITCGYAKYKDRSVGQVTIRRGYYPLWWGINPSEEDQTFIYANFNLEEMIGLGPLKSILPIGVTL